MTIAELPYWLGNHSAARGAGLPIASEVLAASHEVLEDGVLRRVR